MRLKIELRALNSREITYNYHYPMAIAIYNLMKFGTYEFSEYLFKQGFDFAGKRYKLFTFALQFRKFEIRQEYIQMIDNGADLYVSSPLIDTFLQSQVMDSLEGKMIRVQNRDKDIRFVIENVSIMPEPTFDIHEKFVLLSPMISSTRVDIEGVSGTYFLRYFDDIDDINKVLNEDLRAKYRTIFNHETDSSVTLAWDKEYLEINESKHKRMTTNITIDENKRRISIVGNKLPFTLDGDPNLMRIGYDCGFGEKNSLGFGMVKMVKSNNPF